MRFRVTVFFICFGLIITHVSGYDGAPSSYDSFRNTVPAGITLGYRTSGNAASLVHVNGQYRIPIFLYHYVENVQDRKDTIRISLNTEPKIFEEQIKTLVSDGYMFLTMHEVTEILSGYRKAPVKAVALTFDDGYEDFYTDVLPILSAYDVKATLYVVAGFLNHPNYLTTEQLRTIQASGRVEIGSHTVHHVSLAGESDRVVWKELTDSKFLLEHILKTVIRTFAYPYGSYGNRAVDLVNNANYDTAVTTVTGITASLGNRFTLPRIHPGRRVGSALLEYIGTLPD